MAKSAAMAATALSKQNENDSAVLAVKVLIMCRSAMAPALSGDS